MFDIVISDSNLYHKHIIICFNCIDSGYALHTMYSVHSTSLLQDLFKSIDKLYIL